MSLQDNLKQCRERAGYPSARKFAENLGIAYTSYMSYENKGSWPNEENLIKIANALDVSIDALLDIKANEFERCTKLLGDTFFIKEENDHSVTIVFNHRGDCFTLSNKDAFINLVNLYEKRVLADIPYVLRRDLSKIRHPFPQQSELEKKSFNALEQAINSKKERDLNCQKESK